MANRVSGKIVVPLLYGIAVALCAGLLLYGLYYRTRHVVSPPLPAEDRQLLAGYPSDWVRVREVEGQGWAVYVPCEGVPGLLRIEAEAENPRVLCTGCGTPDTAIVRRVGLKGKPVKVRLRLGAAGTAWVEPVGAAGASRFPGAPLPDYVLTWTTPDGATHVFVPAEQSDAFEVLREEDARPEGCVAPDALLE